VWLNTAHQGPLPEPAVAEAEEAIAWKRAPHHLVGRRFHEVPARLRRAVAALVGVSADDVVVTNGASYGVHLLANGLPLGPGDEVLVMAGDFPSNVLPWLGLAARGVTVRRLVSRRGRPVVDPDDLAEALGAPGAGRPRVLCLSWVHSFTGHATDLAALGALCRARGVAFVVNTTQGLGARRLDLPSLPVDAVVNAGWKWLCGPYGTGFLLAPARAAGAAHGQPALLARQPYGRRPPGLGRRRGGGLPRPGHPGRPAPRRLRHRELLQRQALRRRGRDPARGRSRADRGPRPRPGRPPGRRPGAGALAAGQPGGAGGALADRRLLPPRAGAQPRGLRAPPRGRARRRAAPRQPPGRPPPPQQGRRHRAAAGEPGGLSRRLAPTS
jgi:hypothetical protein